MELQSIKQRYGIVGNSPLLNRAIDVASQIAPTDISVLILGQSGVGKEAFSSIIHHLSTRKHGPFIAVNCGAIPEGTIDSELFGHEKGSFTGAHEARKGYFEVVDGGTIFLDEVAELPLSTQSRLLRVLESGEFLRVGSSKVLKTDVRVITATNVKLNEAVAKGKFREDLYYRLSTVPIKIPSLQERKEDIYLLFRKFGADASDKYSIPVVQLTEEAQQILMNYRWPGNVRQLKNIAEQVAILEEERLITAEILVKYMPKEETSQLPVLFGDKGGDNEVTERDLLYRVLFDMKRDIMELKKIIVGVVQNGVNDEMQEQSAHIIQKLKQDVDPIGDEPMTTYNMEISTPQQTTYDIQEPKEEVEESLSLEDREIELIKKALERHKGKRKYAAQVLGISERTLYRKIKEYGIKK